ncbi:hypothetical protein V9T40_011532 [Parthenolecanium corni]|uniref:G-patch domain-containing protein n=1 Tax=Parthenolecanium corni TaxID=536013 RepID=A0AAN9T797_9HEMI
MMFRFGKIIESNNKSSRSDRFAEMSKQQQLIESKKQEIRAKFEERKRQEAVDTAKDSDNRSSNEHKSAKDHKSLISSRMQSWKNDDRWRKKSSSSNHQDSENNLFSNDGSFFEKYKTMADKPPRSDTFEMPTSCESSINPPTAFNDRLAQFSRHSTHDSNIPARSHDSVPKFTDFNDGIPFPPPPLNLHPVSSSVNMSAQPQPLYSITHPPPAPVQLPPPVPGPPVPTSAPGIHTSLAAVPTSVSLIPAIASSAASLQTVSLIQVPVSMPASSVILSCPLETTLVSSEPVVHLPVVQSALSQSSITVPLQTTVIPAQIQITSQAPMPLSSMQTVQTNQSSTNVILSQTTLQPSSILLSSEATAAAVAAAAASAAAVPPPPLPNTNVPPPMLPAQFSQLSATVNSNLPPVHLPPPNFPPVSVPVATQPLESTLPPNFHRNNCSLPYERTLIRNVFKNWPELYDDLSGSSLASESDEQHQKPPPSSERVRHETNRNQLREFESKGVARYGDGAEEIHTAKYSNDEHGWQQREKQNSRYAAYRDMAERNYTENCGASNTFNLKTQSSKGDQNENSSHSSRKISADNDDSEGEEIDDRPRRKRKRKSRWAPESSKVDPSSIATSPAVNVATPSSIGSVVPIIPQSQQNQSKTLPRVGGSPLISQVTRTDPALLQYALKSFGTLNLSEDDWKKAEDHYKINLLYQDMLKKRQELERLQAAGRHKYAYDSDEDTEGGTWEHKLRQQEMVATQLWADELTERSKGRHHIGDFLPPDELERFMEKYNALKQGREPDLSDYKEFKLREDNIGFQMLQKLGWSEGQGLGSQGSGIVNPVNKAPTYATSHGLGVEKPDEVSQDDDEYDAYRKRMMLAYRFRPNPLNNPRRPYY